MEYRRGRITQEYRRWGRPARLARFRARSHSRKAYGGGQTRSFPFSEVFSHYEPSESSETNIRKRPVCPRVPACGRQEKTKDERVGHQRIVSRVDLCSTR